MIKLGILGGGQLGLFIAESALKLNKEIEIHVYDTNEFAPAKDVANCFYYGSFTDRDKLTDFFSNVDIVTYEFENIDNSILPLLDEVNCPQGSLALETMQNRTMEKEWINKLPGVQTVPYQSTNDEIEITYPYIIKTNTEGYDGKGQFLIRRDEDLEKYLKPNMVLEKYLENIEEYSVLIARSKNGDIKTYPLLNNIHINQILYTSKFSNLSEKLTNKMVDKAKQIVESLDYYGVLCVEYFVSEGEVYVNEVAPRVHNSGHITMDAANVSQFELHVRALLGMELPNIEIDESLAMINVLGHQMKAVEELKEIPGQFYDYGKKSYKRDRKVGHINISIDNLNYIKGVLNK